MTPPRSPAVQVCVDTGTETVLAGTAYVSVARGAVSTTFVYDDAWLTRRDVWAISPDLPLSQRSTTAGLPGALADSAPDRWGRNLVKKRLQAQAREQRGSAPTVTDLDFLLGVSDTTRQGALRLRHSATGPFLAEGVTVPKLIELPRVLQATDDVARSGAGDDDLAAVKLLLDAGSASLGGARPKASVRDGDRLLMAKFPHHSDEWDVMAWEMTALDLAERAGLPTPARRLIDVGGRKVLLLDRFDRTGDRRVPYTSAMSLLCGQDGGSYDYVELAEAVTDHGSAVVDDLRQLWRRIAFSIAVHNTDDHMRNHGFLHSAGGWTLAPVFDVNPNPDSATERATTINFTASGDAELEALTEAAGHFDLEADAAVQVWAEVREAVRGWRQVAVRNGIGDAELRLFQDVLDRI